MAFKWLDLARLSLAHKRGSDVSYSSLLHRGQQSFDEEHSHTDGSGGTVTHSSSGGSYTSDASDANADDRAAKAKSASTARRVASGAAGVNISSDSEDTGPEQEAGDDTDTGGVSVGPGTAAASGNMTIAAQQSAAGV